MWILIVAFAVSTPIYDGSAASRHSSAVTMQEFSDLKACQFASLEVQKLATAARVVCIPKGTK